MIRNEGAKDKGRIPAVIKNLTAFDYHEQPSSPLTLEQYLEALARCEPIIPGFDEEEAGPVSPYKDPRRPIEKILKKLSALEIPGKQHVEDYLRDQNRRQMRPDTIRNTLVTLRGFLTLVSTRGKGYLEELSREDVETWIEHEQDRGMKPRTVNTRLRTVKAFLRFLIERSVCRSEVLSKRMSVKIPDALPRAMDPQDIKQLLTVVDTTRDRAMVIVLLRTGMRVGELLNTMVSAVDLKERRIEIFEAEKNRVGRVVYLSDDARDALTAWFKERSPHHEFVFYGMRGNPLTYPAARMRFVKCLHKAGLSSKGYSLHCLRHTFATELLNAGMSLPCLQQLLGHSSIEMTLRYARLTDKTREQEYFKAMAVIERGDNDEHCQLHRQLPTSPEKAQLLRPHGEELYEHP